MDLSDVTHECEPVGASDIADRLSLRPNTIAVYKTRGYFPPSRWTVSGYPAWCWQHDIEPIVVDGKLQPPPKPKPKAKRPRRA